MTPSIVLLGQDRSSEAPLSRTLGGNAQRFFLLAQRILWGNDQPDLVRVDVPKTVRTMLQEYPEAPAAHILAAYGLRRDSRSAADEALARARELAGEDHPDAYLLPTKDEWDGVKPKQQLDCHIPGRLWRVTSYDAVTGLDLARDNIATIVRTDDAGLICVNPVNFDEDVLSSIRELGPVNALVVQGKGHSQGLAHAATVFPDATTFATRAHRSHPPSAALQFEKFLDDESPSSEFLVKPVLGTALEDLVLYHQPTSLLIAQDLFRGNFQSRAQSFASRLYAFSFGLIERVGLLGMQIFLIRDWDRFRQGLEAIGREKPQRLVGAHCDLVEGRELDGLFETIDFVRGLSAKKHKRMLLRYFARQPGFFRDLMKYKRAQKRAMAGH